MGLMHLFASTKSRGALRGSSRRASLLSKSEIKNGSGRARLDSIPSLERVPLNQTLTRNAPREPDGKDGRA
jgi:hypothetical protein